MKHQLRRPWGAVFVGFLLLSACGGGDDSEDQAAEETPDDSDSEEQDGDTASGEPEVVDGELQPLADGFPENELTIINADEPGSADGLYARALQEILNDGLSPVQVNVVDRPSTDFGTWEALNFAANEPGGEEGYVSVVSNVPAAALDHLTVNLEEHTGLSPEDLNVAITTEEVPYVFFQHAEVPWGDTWESMIEYAEENPGEVDYLSLGSGSTVDITMQYLLSEEGVLENIDQSVGGGNVEIATAIAAGEADVSVTAAEAPLPHWQEDRVDVTMVTGENPIEPWTDVPAMTPYLGGDNVLPGRIIGLVMPQMVPDAHRDWINELISMATEDERYQERGNTTPGRVLNNRGPEEAKEVALQNLEQVEPIVRELGMHHEQQ